MDERIAFWPRGKVLGGCSSINAMLYVRGCKGDFDGWAEHGCEGWSYDEVLPYFIKSERCHLDEDLIKTGAHGVHGPLSVSYASGGEVNALSAAFVQAFQEVTGLENPDYNGVNPYGAAISQQTVGNGYRSDTARAFLYNGSNPAIRRPNLTVLTEAHVTKVVIENGKAVGVKFKRCPNGTPKNTFASLNEIFIPCDREVILSAGAVHTPAILMHSGVGPSEHLRSVGIDVLKDMPGVGRNLQDHLFLGLTFKENRGVSYTGGLLDTLRYFAKYVWSGKGPIAGSPIEVLAFLDSEHNSTKRKGKHPDLEYHVLPALISKAEHYTAANSKPVLELSELTRMHGLTIFPTLLLPESVGYIELKSNNPMDDIVVEPNYLVSEYDVNVLVDGVKKAREIAKSKAFKSYELQEIVDPTIPASFETEEYIREYVKRQAITVYHPVGTAKMGRTSDPMAVVDSKCRVIGLEGLRVADASIMPRIVAANTNAACIMIGEKAADIVKADWRK